MMRFAKSMLAAAAMATAVAPMASFAGDVRPGDSLVSAPAAAAAPSPILPAGAAAQRTGAVAEVPARFLQWLRPGGRLFVVRGVSLVMEAVLHVNDVNGARVESLFETDLPYLVGAAPAPQFVF